MKRDDKFSPVKNSPNVDVVVVAVVVVVVVVAVVVVVGSSLLRLAKQNFGFNQTFFIQLNI